MKGTLRIEWEDGSANDGIVRYVDWAPAPEREHRRGTVEHNPGRLCLEMDTFITKSRPSMSILTVEDAAAKLVEAIRAELKGV